MRRLARPLMYAGVVGIVLALSKYHAETIGDYDFTASFRFTWAFAYIGLLCLSAYGLGLPEVPRTLRSRLPTSLMASATGALGISAVQLFVGDALLPRFVVFGSALLLVPWYYAMSTLAGAGRRSLERRDRVVVVGPPELAEEISVELSMNPEKPAAVAVAMPAEIAADVSEHGRPLVDVVRREQATVLVLSGDAQEDERIIDQAAQLHEQGVRVRTQSLFYEEWLGKLPVADLGRVALFFDIGEVHRDRFSRFKRLVDVAAGTDRASSSLVLVIPFVFGRATSSPTVVRSSTPRTGSARAGTVFTIHKFRTMRDDGNIPTDWTGEDDPRITPFGNLLRRTHLDELPQVWNIVRGDLSLVGPRPEQPRYVAELVEKLPFYDLRHIVRPGLTGWAQVKYGYAGDERDALGEAPVRLPLPPAPVVAVRRPHRRADRSGRCWEARARDGERAATGHRADPGTQRVSGYPAAVSAAVLAQELSTRSHGDRGGGWRLHGRHDCGCPRQQLPRHEQQVEGPRQSPLVPRPAT
ncbi:MAG: sugar transferase [Acidimicrobiales bacterium]|nr:sugar transferase [Acidimicrobiales bacterium]